MKEYLVNEIFLSVQGEGIRAGTLNVFLRLAKCNMRCAVEPGERSPGGFDCDTEFESGRRMTAIDIVAACDALWPRQSTRGEGVGMPKGEKWVVVTGGEPLLQYDYPLFKALHDGGWHVAIETNGSMLVPCDGDGVDEENADVATRNPRDLDNWLILTFYADWITVSPKVAEHAIKQRWAHEVKYVRGAGQAVPQTVVRAVHRLVSPAHDGLRLDPAALATCIDIVREDPRWRVSVQAHKAWRVR